MKRIDLADYKAKLVTILSAVDTFCKSKNLVYFLDSGTLLGAVRHKGFIPWDDDIDIVMPRDDYEIFIEQFGDQEHRIISFANTKSYYYQFAKVTCVNSKLVEHGVPPVNELGINIDVFPLDGMPENKLLRRFHQDALSALSKIRTLIVVLRNRLPKRLQFLLPYRWIINRIDSMGKRYKYQNSTYVGNIVATRLKHIEFPRCYFQKSVALEFENKKYQAPIGYDKYLRGLYGDYTSLPPKDKQVSHHHFEAYIEES